MSSPLVIVTSIATQTIVVALQATVMMDMIAENLIASLQLVTSRAKVSMPNTVTDPDQERDRIQDPILMTLKNQDMIMVTIFMMMTPGERNSHLHPLLSLV